MRGSGASSFRDEGWQGNFPNPNGARHLCRFSARFENVSRKTPFVACDQTLKRHNAAPFVALLHADGKFFWRVWKKLFQLSP
jgi:hypothetical protein